MGGTVENIVDTIMYCEPPDVFAQGIWTSSVKKSNTLLWHLRWGKLPSKDRLRKRGMNIDSNWHLCG